MKRVLFLILTILVPVFLLAQQPGANDLTFNTIDGAAYGDGSGFDDLVKTTSIQADGKIIAGGWFDKYNGTQRGLIARINPDGSNDPSFNIGVGFYGLGSEYVSKTVIQPDGKILVGGEFAVIHSTNRKNIARLNTNGSVDATFNPGTGFNAGVSAIVIQPDGKILVGGSFTQYNGAAANRLVRLNANGTLDATFSIGTGSTGGIRAMALQPDGKILVGGFFTQFNGTPYKYMVRLNANGSIDPTFVIGTGFSYTVNEIALQSDGKVVVGGEFSTYNGVSAESIIRLNSDGTVDPAFTYGTGFNGNVYSIKINGDGKIIIAGGTTQYNGTVIGNITRLNTDGTIDLTFTNGSGTVGEIESISIQSDGKIVAGGDFASFNGRLRNCIGRFNVDKSFDPTFMSVFGSNSQIVTAVIQPDDKIVIGGDFSEFNEFSINKIARLLPDGQLDTSFHTGSGFDSQAYTVNIQPDGKIIAGGFFTTYDGVSVNKIVRLNTDGTLDNTFNTTGTGPNSLVTSTAVQPDGKIIVGGWFTSFSSTSKNRIARVNANGTLDATFNPGTGFNNWVYETTLQPDGKVLVGGYFTLFNGVSRNHMARLKTNGSLDTSFHVDYVDAEVLSVVMQPDGKILVGGNFTIYQGSRNRINRLLPDGSNDPTFNIGTGFNAGVYSIHVQSDGKIIVGGNFTSFNGTPINRIARLNPDGSLDLTFNPAPGFNDWVFAGGFQSNGKFIAAGKFTPLNGSIPRNRIARLLTVCTLSLSGSSISNVSCFGGSNGAIDITPGGGVAPYTCDWGGGITTEDRTGLTAGTYSVTVTDFEGCTTTFNQTVTQPNVLSASTTSTNVTCFGNTNGTINLTPIGGTAPYIVNWNDGVTTEDRSNLNIGTYSATISDANGCTTNSGNVTITQPAAALSVSTAVTDITCFGGASGAIDLTVTGGTTPYAFAWNDGGISEDRAGLTAGNYSVTITDSNGCNVSASLTILQNASSISATTSITNVSCFGGSNGEIDLTPGGGTLPYSFDWGGGVTTEDRTGLSAGTYPVTITDANGCTVINAVVTQPLAALSVSETIYNVSCYGGSDGYIDITISGGTMPYTTDWDGMNVEDLYNVSEGNYELIVTDFNGCISTHTYTVSQPLQIVSSFAANACYSYSWNGQNYTTSGSYTQVFPASNSCDSTVTLNLTINQATTSSITQTACNSFTLNGQTYTSSGIYTQNLTNVHGCDSTLTLNLTIKYATSSSMTQTACNSFTLNGQTYTSGGVYTQNLTNVAGCDSTLTLNLTINQPSGSLMTQTACNSFTLNGQTYTVSGIYTQQFTNAAGCDSILTLHLTINHTALSSVTQTACDSYTLNGQTYAVSGVYTQNLTSAAGCDSILTLNLTITHATTSSIMQTACDSYTLNGQTYTSTGLYTQLLTNAAGCDSTLTLDLVVNPSPVVTAVDNGDGTITASAATSHQWINCSTGALIPGAITQTFSPTVNGTYAVIGSSAQGCSDTSACIAIDNLGVKEQDLFEISLAPNPTTDQVQIQFSGSDVTLIIRDAQGKELNSQAIVSGDQISLKNYADGVYFFEFITSKGQTTLRVVKN